MRRNKVYMYVCSECMYQLYYIRLRHAAMVAGLRHAAVTLAVEMSRARGGQAVSSVHAEQ